MSEALQPDQRCALAEATVAGRYFEAKHAQIDRWFWCLRFAVCLVDVIDFTGSDAEKNEGSKHTKTFGSDVRMILSYPDISMSWCTQRVVTA